MPAEVEKREDDAMMQLVEKYYRLLIRVSSSLQSPFLLAVRLYWGWQFMQTGWGKLTDINKVVGFFTGSGHTRACVERLLCLGARVRGRPPSDSGARLATDRAAAGDRHDRRLHHGGSRGAVLDHFESRQICGRGALYIPDRFSDRADLRPRQGICRRVPDGTTRPQSNAANFRWRVAGRRSELSHMTTPPDPDS